MSLLPSEDHILTLFRTRTQQQFTIKALLKHFAIPAALRPAFRRRIKAMAAAGQLLNVRGSRYALPERSNVIVGEIKRHEDGYGFLTPADETLPDVYIGRPAMRGVMDGDRAMVKLDAGQHREARQRGRVVEVLERDDQDVVGRIEFTGNTCRLMPLDARVCPDILIPPRWRHGVQSGQVAVADIRRYNLGDDHPEGQISEIIGDDDDPAMEVEIIRRKYDLPNSFPPDVETAAEAIPREVTASDLAGRLDLRQIVTFTIDGETARDFDDAVSLEIMDQGQWRLGVHIADVSHYVTERGWIDREAYHRGTSVYFPDRVIPMLPERLSNDICSLKPDVDRLTLSALLEVTPEGDLIRYDLVESVIHSQARLTYTRVADYLAGNDLALDGLNPDIGNSLVHMKDLALVLRHARLQAGSLDFDLPETEVVLDADGRVERIAQAERNVAHSLIEEFMLLANRTVATHLANLNVPMLYRVHEPPVAERLEPLYAAAAALGYGRPAGETLSPHHMQQVLDAAQGRPEERFVNYLLLRAMQRAHYTAEPGQHFGLSVEHYTHFTSPIRRYPDLLVHRLLRDTLRAGGMAPERKAFWSSTLSAAADHASARERLSDEASREVVSVKKVEWMRGKIGETYPGVISGVIPIGFFVELEGLLVEGLVHINRLPGSYVFHEDRLCLVSQATGESYRIGDRVEVRVDHANIQRRQVDFSFLTKL